MLLAVPVFVILLPAGGVLLFLDDDICNYLVLGLAIQMQLFSISVSMEMKIDFFES